MASIKERIKACELRIRIKRKEIEIIVKEIEMIQEECEHAHTYRRHHIGDECETTYCEMCGKEL